MPAQRKSDERNVTRTYRAAIRIGEDFITLEETITLPFDASDDEVRQAVDLGWRIYQHQREAVERQISSIREDHQPTGGITIREPDAPASDKQRNYIAALQDDLAWSGEQLGSFAASQGVDLVTLTKGQASVFIDSLKRVAEERPRTGDSYGTRPASDEGGAADQLPLTERQLAALNRLAPEKGFDLVAEVRQRYNVDVSELRMQQASTLIQEWQRLPRTSQSRAVASDNGK